MAILAQRTKALRTSPWRLLAPEPETKEMVEAEATANSSIVVVVNVMAKLNELIEETRIIIKYPPFLA